MRSRSYHVDEVKGLKAISALAAEQVNGTQATVHGPGSVLSVKSDRDDIDLIVTRAAPSARLAGEDFRGAIEAKRQGPAATQR